MAFNTPPWCVFFIVVTVVIIIISIILTDPKAFPRTATDDDEYDGYYIPKGTNVVANTWPV